MDVAMSDAPSVADSHTRQSQEHYAQYGEHHQLHGDGSPSLLDVYPALDDHQNLAGGDPKDWSGYQDMPYVHEQQEDGQQQHLDESRPHVHPHLQTHPVESLSQARAIDHEQRGVSTNDVTRPHELESPLTWSPTSHQDDSPQSAFHHFRFESSDGEATIGRSSLQTSHSSSDSGHVSTKATKRAPMPLPFMLGNHARTAEQDGTQNRPSGPSPFLTQSFVQDDPNAAPHLQFSCVDAEMPTIDPRQSMSLPATPAPAANSNGSSTSGLLSPAHASYRSPSTHHSPTMHDDNTSPSQLGQPSSATNVGLGISGTNAANPGLASPVGSNTSSSSSSMEGHPVTHLQQSLLPPSLDDIATGHAQSSDRTRIGPQETHKTQMEAAVDQDRARQIDAQIRAQAVQSQMTASQALAYTQPVTAFPHLRQMTQPHPLHSAPPYTTPPHPYHSSYYYHPQHARRGYRHHPYMSSSGASYPAYYGQPGTMPYTQLPYSRGYAYAPHAPLSASTAHDMYATSMLTRQHSNASTASSSGYDSGPSNGILSSAAAHVSASAPATPLSGSGVPDGGYYSAGQPYGVAAGLTTPSDEMKMAALQLQDTPIQYSRHGQGVGSVDHYGGYDTAAKKGRRGSHPSYGTSMRSRHGTHEPPPSYSLPPSREPSSGPSRQPLTPGVEPARSSAIFGDADHASSSSIDALANLPTKRSRGRRPLVGPELDLDNMMESIIASTEAQIEFSGLTKTGKPKKIFICRVPGCDKCFKRSEHLKRHVRSIHTNDKPWPCEFPGCNKSFARSDNLKQHTKNLHPEWDAEMSAKKEEVDGEEEEDSELSPVEGEDST